MSREQVWRLWSAGRLPGYKLDRYLRFAPSDIERFLAKHYSVAAPLAGAGPEASVKRKPGATGATKYIRI